MSDQDNVIEEESRKERSAGFKFMLTIVLAGLLSIPLLMVYALNYDRQGQAETARNSIAAGWANDQILTGPVVVIPYNQEVVETVTENDQERTRTVKQRRLLYLSPQTHEADYDLAPDVITRSIYETTVYEAAVKGKARFAIPDDIARYGVARGDLLLNEAELRLGISDPRGIRTDAKVLVNDEVVALRPGKGLTSSGNSGFFAFLDWSTGGVLAIDYAYSVRGNGYMTLVPRGGETQFTVTSSWPHPSFVGDFLPDTREVGPEGFTAQYAIGNLALGQALVLTDDPGQPNVVRGDTGRYSSVTYAAEGGTNSQSVQINLIDPVNLYSQVERSVKYGFLFIGFTFLAFLLFDIIGGARVASAEYFLTGSGLVLFFVMLLALAEVVGFTLAYILAAIAIVGLLSAYSAAILGSWQRAGFIGAMLTGLYGVLYVLLNLEAYSLLVGSALLFIALATVMYVTRGVDWSRVEVRKKQQPDLP